MADLMARWAAEGSLQRMLKRFSSLLFLSSDSADLAACLREALAVRRLSLATWIGSGVGEVEMILSKDFLHLRTFLSFLRISGQTQGFLVLVADKSIDLLVERAAKERKE